MFSKLRTFFLAMACVTGGLAAVSAFAQQIANPVLSLQNPPGTAVPGGITPPPAGVPCTGYYIYDPGNPPGSNQPCPPGRTLSRNDNAGTNQTELSRILTGDSSNPLGIVELCQNSEAFGPLPSPPSPTPEGPYGFFSNYTGPRVCLTGNLPAGPIELCSSLYNDLVPTGVAQNYYNAFFAAHPGLRTVVESNLFSSCGITDPFNQVFLQTLKFLIDPNIAYVNQTGYLISIGLEGNLNYTADYVAGLEAVCPPPNWANLIAPFAPLQASEIVRVNFLGTIYYLYSFVATPSCQTAADPTESYDGNYEVTINVPPPPPPVPIHPFTVWLTMLGLALTTVFYRRRQHRR